MDSRRTAGWTIGAAPYWLLARSKDADGGASGYYDVLTVGAGAERILPLFGSEEAAVSFLGCFASESRRIGWRATEAGAGELLMLLSASESPEGPCAVVGEIAFDPPEALVEERNPDVPTVGRRVFMDRLLGRGGRWSGAR